MDLIKNGVHNLRDHEKVEVLIHDVIAPFIENGESMTFGQVLVKMKEEYINKGLNDYVQAANEEALGVETALGIATRRKKLSGAKLY